MELGKMSFEEKKDLATKLEISFPHNILEATLEEKIKEKASKQSVKEEKMIPMEIVYRGQKSNIDVLESKVEAHKKAGWKVV